MTSKKSKKRKIIGGAVGGTALALLVAIVIYAVVCNVTGRMMNFFGTGYSCVLTGSMEPTIPTHSIVSVKMIDESDVYNLTADEENGDIIVFEGTVQGKSAYIIHRLVAFNEDGTLVTRGDNNNQDDEPITADKVVGVYGRRMPVFSWFSRLLHTSYGFVLMLLIPCVGLVICHVVTIVKSSTDISEEQRRKKRIDEIKAEAIREFTESQKLKNAETETPTDNSMISEKSND